MKIGFDNALGIHEQALSLRSARTDLLARNIANADTPGYHARDIDFAAELNKAMGNSELPASVAIRATHAGHQAAATGKPDIDRLYRVPLVPSFDGNTVDAQTEQAAFAENNVQFLASLRFLDGRFRSMLSAIKGE
ncbi:MAG: flagellar basal body rod protein FlgB [Pseudomonadales bacterium]|nr:flagellar basal body rod protein FlgB [Pseudomonadales bacterium]